MLVERVRGQVSYKKVEFLLLSLIVWSMNLYNTAHCLGKRKRKKLYGSTPKDSTPHHHKNSKTHIAAAIAPHSMGCICRCDTTKARCFTPETGEGQWCCGCSKPNTVSRIGEGNTYLMCFHCTTGPLMGKGYRNGVYEGVLVRLTPALLLSFPWETGTGQEMGICIPEVAPPALFMGEGNRTS
jgi:hypothetical protein